MSVSVERRRTAHGTWCRHRRAIVSEPWWGRYRDRVHAAGTGRVLEIGAPDRDALDFRRASSVTVVQARPEPVSHRASNAWEVVDARADRLPFPSGAFDVVVCTLSLCCAEDPGAVIHELRRVLRPRGHVDFLEHVRNPGLLSDVRHRFGSAVGRDRCRVDSEPLALLLQGGFVLRRADIAPPGALLPMPLISGVAVPPSVDEARELTELLGL